jgi:3-hydroxy-D-aspartate aldolase
MSHTPASRRAFLAAASAAGGSLLVSRRGAAAAPAPTMDSTLIGTSKWDLDTPALCVDLDRLEGNIATMQARVTKQGIATRPHAKTHKCAAIAKLQLAAGAIGICTAKVSEAEALMDAGVDRLCMTTSNPAVSKIRRAMRLRQRSPHFIQAVDEAQNARDLNDAAKEAGVCADVVIDVAVGTRSGIPAGPDVIALAQLIDRLPHLRLRGMLSYDGGAQHVTGFAERKRRALEAIAPNAELFAQLTKAGHAMEIFSGGGTGTYSVQHLVPGFTDVQVGSYVFMDMQYLAVGGEDGPVYRDFDVSLTVMATMLNNRFPGRLTTDAGAKALTLNQPTAGVIGEPGFSYNAGSDEFGVITFTESAKRYAIGDRLELIVPHCDPAVNLYDRIHAVRKDRVEAVWAIDARGRSQ